MNIDDYPEQEPLSDIGSAYQKESLRLSDGLEGDEAFYAADDPCQGVLVFPADKPNGIVLMSMHGGGWTNGYKEMMAFVAPPMNEAGITFVSVGYRMAPATVFPDGWLDAARGLAWIYRHAADFGADRDKVFVGGHSAGGHYAALLAVRRDWQETVGVPADVIKGALPISGIYRFGEGSGLAMRPRFLGPEEAAQERPASPIVMLEARAVPPMLLAHGDRDFPHLIVQAKAFEQALEDHGADVQRLEMQGRTHFGAHYAAGEFEGPWAPRAIEWMRQRV